MFCIVISDFIDMTLAKSKGAQWPDSSMAVLKELIEPMNVELELSEGLHWDDPVLNPPDAMLLILILRYIPEETSDSLEELLQDINDKGIFRQWLVYCRTHNSPIQDNDLNAICETLSVLTLCDCRAMSDLADWIQILVFDEQIDKDCAQYYRERLL